MTIENARLFQATQRHALQMETASLVGQRVTALLDLDALLSEVAGLVRVKFNYDYVQILLVDELAREIVLKAASGISAELASLRELHLPLGDKGITVWVAQTGQALLCNDVRRESRYLAVELLPDTKAELAVPLRVGTRVLGVLDVQSNHFNSFTKEDITVLQILGNQLGIAIENARLFGETKRRYRAMLALHETSLDVISELDRQQLLDELVRRGVHLWEAKAGGLWLYNPSKDVLEVVAHYNYDKDFDSGLVMRPGEGMVGTVFQTRQPMMIEDYPNWRDTSSLRRHGNDGCYGCPTQIGRSNNRGRFDFKSSENASL